MITQDQAQIYIAGQRGKTTSEGFRSLRTLNFGDYFAPGREPVGLLLSFEYNELDASQSIEIKHNTILEVVLIPIAGGLELVNEQNASVFVSPGESFCFKYNPENNFSIANPYAVETIHYLQLSFQLNLSDFDIQSFNREALLSSFNLNDKNKRSEVFTNADKNISVWIGQYGVRNESVVSISQPEKIAFTYIIRGAFEVQNRLLETGDALTLWHVNEFEFESLADDGVILIILQ